MHLTFQPFLTSPCFASPSRSAYFIHSDHHIPIRLYPKPQSRRPHFLATSTRTPASSAPPSPSHPPSLPLQLPLLPRIYKLLGTLWQFSRPHTMLGTIISITSLTSVASLETRRILTLHYPTALFLSCLINLYIVGLNQITDVDIDAINKPHLPLPSKLLTIQTATSIITTSLLSTIILSFAVPGSSTTLRIVLGASAILGTIYSAPPFRLKRFPILASLSILSVRGIIVNLGFYLHALGKNTLTCLTILPKFAAFFFVMFGIVIALMKDIPDIKGDFMFGIATFSVKLGPARILNFCMGVLYIMYIVAAGFFVMITRRLAFRVLLPLTHLGVVVLLMRRVRNVDPFRSKSVYQLYMDVWKLFYLEYLCLPFAVF